MNHDGLWPAPRKCTIGKGSLALQEKITIALPQNSSIRVAIHKLATIWEMCCWGDLIACEKTDKSSSFKVQTVIDSGIYDHEEAYAIRINGQGICLSAASERGLFYALTTLGQWVRSNYFHRNQKLTHLPYLDVDDWPDFQHRGFMIDISRSKVPTMETLYSWIDFAVEFKINQIQLYTEHTFAYKEHETVWKDASPLTGQDIQIREMSEFLIPVKIV